MPGIWAERFAARASRHRSSVIRELLKVSSRPDVISFAGGLPAPDTFPVERFQWACRMVLARHGSEALQYGPTEGYQPLREFIAAFASRHGAAVAPDNVLITTGSQQALDLVGKVFADEGDEVVVESPTYLGALQAWNPYGVRYTGVEVDQEGLRVDRIDDACGREPKFLYVIPNYQNPTGATLSAARRDALVRLAHSRRLAIVEDDPYGQLVYDGEPLPSLLALDADVRRARTLDEGHVLSLGTLSKVLAPGLRLGWIVGPPEVVERLTLAKQAADLHTSTFTQMVAYEVLRGGFLDGHVQRLRRVYRERRDTMLAALEETFPPEIRWTRPAGGLFVWVTLPPDVDAADLLRAALAERVAFVPGRPFFADESVGNALRLNFSHAPPDTITEGIGRLARVLRRLAADRLAPEPVASR